MKVDEAFTKVFSKYADFANIFLSKLAIKLFEYIKINNYTIKLVDDWQPLYSSIYSLKSIDLEMLKTYIENNLANGFIRPSKFLARIPIFFDKKLNRSLKLCMDYCSFNNLIIKN